MDIKNKLGEYFYDKIGIDNKTKYEIKKVNAQDLFTYTRLDLIAKYLYIIFKKESIKSNLAMDIYKEHLRAFSNGTFIESGNSLKNSFDAYVREFDKLFDDIERNGFDNTKSMIPVGNNNSIIDGGHRVAIAAYLNKEVDTIIFKDKSGPIYDYLYFRNRQLEDKYLDVMVNYYCEIKKREIYICCLWPIAAKRGLDDEVRKILREETNLIYEKRVKFTYQGLKSLQIQLYRNQDWIGTSDNEFLGVYGKLDACFANYETVFFIIEGGSLTDILKIKEKIRLIYNNGKHSIHITDTYEEARETMKLILNKNSIHNLNYANSFRNKTFLDFLKNNNFGEDSILSPHFTLVCYKNNIGNCMDLKDSFLENDELDFDIKYDTRNFFYFFGKKFLSLEKAYNLVSINEKKLLKEIMRKKNDSIFMIIKKYIKRIKYYTIIKVKNIIKILGLYSIVDKFYKKLRRY